MKKLLETTKITAATFKSFVKRNSDNLWVMNISDFNGMTDGIEHVENPKWKKTFLTGDDFYKRSWVEFVYMVGHGRDYFRLYEDENFIGINVYNCCGSCNLAIKK